METWADGGSGAPSSPCALLDLGTIYLHLGYSEHAGLYLGKADKLKTSMNKHELVQSHMAHAEYFLRLGDAQRW